MADHDDGLTDDERTSLALDVAEAMMLAVPVGTNPGYVAAALGLLMGRLIACQGYRRELTRNFEVGRDAVEPAALDRSPPEQDETVH